MELLDGALALGERSLDLGPGADDVLELGAEVLDAPFLRPDRRLGCAQRFPGLLELAHARLQLAGDAVEPP